MVAVGDMELLRITREWEVGVGLMTQLQTLHLHHNRLPALPDQMDRLIQLTTLTLDDNMVTTHPPPNSPHGDSAAWLCAASASHARVY